MTVNNPAPTAAPTTVTQGTQQSPTQPSALIVDGSPRAPANVDWFLQTFVASVNSHEGFMGVTLQMGGFLVSGFLISGAVYFEEFAKQYAADGEDESDKAVFRRYANEFREAQAKEAASPPEAGVTPPQFVHLRNARFYQSSGQPILGGETGVLWRGRITEVQGFVLGEIGPIETGADS
ncbi:hypothetical protein PQQ81_00995 [Paraburkholderia strydomiana]|uniref:gas vesicle accessory protein GvpU n=1 Tax=Paraburkholderia strydomiana TaxID=1245417 RepID=UPI0038BCB062